MIKYRECVKYKLLLCIHSRQSFLLEPFETPLSPFTGEAFTIGGPMSRSEGDIYAQSGSVFVPNLRYGEDGDTLTCIGSRRHRT